MNEFEILTIQQGNREFMLSLIVAIISFISALLIYLDYSHRKRKEKAEKSILIAKDFADNIISSISIIFAFFKEFEIDKITGKTNFLQLEYFDIEELKTIYNDEDIKKYRDKINTNDEKYEIRTIICNTLNELEYMCMYISTNVADEKYIYSSLHQQFLKAISLLYFEISFANIDNKDKYYTNIIHVYNIWKNKYIKISKKEDKFKDKFKKKNKKMKNKLLPSPPKV